MNNIMSSLVWNAVFLVINIIVMLNLVFNPYIAAEMPTFRMIWIPVTIYLLVFYIVKITLAISQRS